MLKPSQESLHQFVLCYGGTGDTGVTRIKGSDAKVARSQPRSLPEAANVSVISVAIHFNFKLAAYTQ
jgi:hypothetical protein